MSNEQQERHRRFEERFVREDGLLDIDKYSHDEILSFLDEEVSLAVSNRDKEIVEVYKERIEKYQNTTTLSTSTANALIAEYEFLINLISKNNDKQSNTRRLFRSDERNTR